MHKYSKKIIIYCLLILQTIVCVGCGKKEENNKINIIYGTDVLVSGKVGNGVYIKNYDVMDCCDDFYAITPLVEELENATAYEIYDLDLFNSEGKECQPEGNVNIQLMISKELIASNGNRYTVYSLDGDHLLELDAKYENGVVTFSTDTIGIYTIVKFGDTSQGVNFALSGCDGTCKTCD